MPAQAPASPYSEAFFDEQVVGSLNSARVVLEQVWQFFQPTSVIDVGCGLAPWLKVAADLGAAEIVGVDGVYVQRDKLLIDPACFHSCDLEQGELPALQLGKKFDLVMSMEVAEHLAAERALPFISALCKLGDLVLFSAAVPGQGGVNHFNEQWPSYWAKLFEKCGFSCFDFIRSRIWNNDGVEWWYAQNVIVFARKDSKASEILAGLAPSTDQPLPLVHPRMHAHVLYYEHEYQRDLERKVFENPFGRDDQIRILEEKIDNLRERLAIAGSESEALKERNKALKAECEHLDNRHRAIVESISWRITAPLRIIKRAVS